jgi:heat shock protein HslJ
MERRVSKNITFYMNTKVLILISSVVALLLLGIGVSRIFFAPSSTPAPIPVATTTLQGIPEAISPKEATYTINGNQVTLVHGISVTDSAPGSATKITTRYFGNEVVHDFNGDGRPDTAFILTQDTGGSGVFYYAVAALNTPRGYVGSQGFLLGDRIAPQATNIDEGTTTVGTKRQNVIVFNYAERKQGESFATPPSVGKSVWLKLDSNTMQFGEVVQNFEGETSPPKMTLGMKTWNWVNTLYSNGSTTVPRVANKFTLTFSGTNRFSAATDCNGVGGEYAATGSSITFSRIMSTLMYCENSQESDYAKMFSEVQSYHFTSKGELVFNLKFDSGSFIFK